MDTDSISSAGRSAHLGDGSVADGGASGSSTTVSTPRTSMGSSSIMMRSTSEMSGSKSPKSSKSAKSNHGHGAHSTQSATHNATKTETKTTTKSKPKTKSKFASQVSSIPLPTPSSHSLSPSSLRPSPRRTARSSAAGEVLRSGTLSLDPAPGPGPTAHDITKSAQSALQLLQARSELQAQQQRDARRRTHSRAEAHARLDGSMAPSSPAFILSLHHVSDHSATASEPNLKQRHRVRDSVQSFFSASSRPTSPRTRLFKDSAIGHPVENFDLNNASQIRPASIRSNMSDRSNPSRTSFRSAQSSFGVPNSAFSDFDVPSTSSKPFPKSSSHAGHRGRTQSATDAVPSPPDFHSSYSSFPWDEAPRPPPPAPSLYTGRQAAWRDYLSPPPERQRARSATSAPGSRRPSFSDDHPARPSSTRRPSPMRSSTVPPTPSTGPANSFTDLSSLRALDVGHAQLAHYSSLARTLTKPLSAPLKPVLQFWLAMSLSTLALVSLSCLMVCSYLLTMYDDASRRTRVVRQVAAKATSNAPPVYAPMRKLAGVFLSPLGKMLWQTSCSDTESDHDAQTEAEANGTERRASDDDDVGGSKEDDDPLSPPGPRPPIGPLSVSLALTLTVAMGAGLFRLVASYRTSVKRFFDPTTSSTENEDDVPRPTYVRSHTDAPYHRPKSRTASRPSSRTTVR